MTSKPEKIGKTKILKFLNIAIFQFFEIRETLKKRQIFKNSVKKLDFRNLGKFVKSQNFENIRNKSTVSKH